MIHTLFSHNMPLVIISFIIAAVSSYAALGLIGRLRISTGHSRAAWLVGGSIVLGLGIWSMHFIAMLAYQSAVPITYNFSTVFISLLAAIFMSFLSLMVIGQVVVTTNRLWFGSLLMTLGIISMHYIGMAAVQISAILSYDPLFIFLSFVIAFATSYAAFRYREKGHNGKFRIDKMASGLMMGTAVCGMHYTGMAAVTLEYLVPVSARQISASPMNHLWLAISISMGTLIILGFAFAMMFTDRRLKEIEEHFKRLDQQHSLILSSVSEGIYGIDLHNKTVFWNEAAKNMTQFQPSEVIGKNIHSLIHHTRLSGDSFSAADCPIYATTKDGVARHVNDDVFWRKDGTYFHVEYSVTPMVEQHSIKGSVITFSDITERKKTEELMMLTEKLSMAGELAAGIAHEIRNPLTAIKGFIQLMKNQISEKKEYFHIITSELERIELITTELLMLAKPQINHFKEKDLRHILGDVITLLETQTIINNIEIVTRFDSTALPIHCDENQIKQVYLNMIKNAIESMKKDGNITITATKQHDLIVTEVADQGVGIPADQLSKLGHPFYSTKEKGTGLGLMVTYKIIENHGGSVQVQSEVGKGTCFTVSLPTAREYKSSAEEHA
jgi:PAS domain S-box-containing protein